MRRWCRGSVVCLIAVGALSASGCRGDAPSDSPALRGWRAKVEAAKKAAEADPQNAEFWKDLATAWLGLFGHDVDILSVPDDQSEAAGQEAFAGARLAIGKAVELAPDDPEAHLMRAWLLAVDFADEDELGEQLKQGLAEAERAAGLAPDDYFYQKAFADYRFMVGAHFIQWRGKLLGGWEEGVRRAEGSGVPTPPAPEASEVEARSRELRAVAAQYEALIERWSDKAELHLGLARVYGPGHAAPSLADALGGRAMQRQWYESELRTASDLDPTNAFPVLRLAAYQAEVVQRRMDHDDAVLHSAVVAAVRPLLEGATERERYVPYQPSYPKGWGQACWTATGQFSMFGGHRAYRAIWRSLHGEAKRLTENKKIDEAATLWRLGIAMGRVLTTSPDDTDALTGHGIWWDCGWQLAQTGNTAGGDLRKEGDAEMAAAEQWKKDFLKSRPWLGRNREAPQKRGTPAGT